MKTQADVEPGCLDALALRVVRPWVLAMAAAFLMTPSYWLCAALNSGAAFLKMDTGARPAAMGGAYTAIADDVNAIYYNPGGLANIRRREIGVTHVQWLLDSRFDFMGYVQPTPSGAFGFGLTRFTSGAAQARDPDRKAGGGFESSDTAYTFGYSRRVEGGAIPFLGRKAGVGVNVKLLESRIAGYRASAVAMDFGIVRQSQHRPLSVGLAVLNVGGGMRFLEQTDPLPTTVAVGGAYRLAGALQLALDLRRQVNEKVTDLGIGTEYSVSPSFVVRAGYASVGPAGPGGSPLGGLGGGFGLRTSRYRADYTLTPFGAMGNAHRLSLGARF